MRVLTPFIALSLVFSLALARKPPRVLLLTGGCWHNYTEQEQSIRNAFIRAGVVIHWTVARLPCRKPAENLGELAMVRQPNWSAPYDLVFMNGCYQALKRPAYIDDFVRGFQGSTPLVALHCGVHSFNKSPAHIHWKWHQVLGVSSTEHVIEHRHYPIRLIASKSQIMSPLKRAGGVYWTPMDELYIVDKVWPQAHVLAHTWSPTTKKMHPVFWTNLYRGRTKVFAASFGHVDATLRDHVFMDTVVRGALWTLGILKDTSWATSW